MDISESGLLVATSLSLVSDSFSQVHIQMAGIEGGVTVTGRTVRTDEATQRAAIEMLNMTALNRSRLWNWMHPQIGSPTPLVAAPIVIHRKPFIEDAAESMGSYNEAVDTDESISEMRHFQNLSVNFRHRSIVRTNRVLTVAGTLLAMVATFILGFHLRSTGHTVMPEQSKAQSAEPEYKMLFKGVGGVSDSAIDPGPFVKSAGEDSRRPEKEDALEVDPGVVLITSRGGSPSNLVKLPERMLVRSDLLEINSQRSMFISHMSGSQLSFCAGLSGSEHKLVQN